MFARELIVSYRTTAGSGADRPVLAAPAAAARYLATLQPTAGVPWADEAVELFIVLLADTTRRPIAWHLISRGTLDATLVQPREVFRSALVAGAASIILAHNHPSGDPTPSPDDRELTRRLRAAGELLGIPVVDHVVLGHAGRYCSLVESGLL